MNGASLAFSPAPLHDPVTMMTGMQIKAALGLLGWGYRDLADKTGMSKNTIDKLANLPDERSGGMAKSWRAVQDVLEAEGVEFIKAGEPLPPGGPGVRLRLKDGGREP